MGADNQRVVITGLGMVTPLGIGTKPTWDALLRSESGVRTITHFDASQLPSQISATVKNFDASVLLSKREARQLDTFIQYALVAAQEAMDDAALEVNDSNAYRMGTCIGSGIGGLPSIEANQDRLKTSGPRAVSPFFVPGAIINSATGCASMRFGLRGPNLSVVTACASGSHAIATSVRHIRYGDADVMLAGGTEMATSALGMAGFSALRALSKNNAHPEQASRPWDEHRDGFVLADGACVMVLESYQHAKARGATIYAEIAGCGFSGDAYHITAPDPDAKGATHCMKLALDDAGLNPEAIQYINAHATSTKIGDLSEITAIKQCFGSHAKALQLSSTKSMHGHLLGASGALEAGLCALSLQHQTVLPTINLDSPDEGCDLDFVPQVARSLSFDACLSNSFGFGGTNACLVFKKV